MRARMRWAALLAMSAVAACGAFGSGTGDSAVPGADAGVATPDAMGEDGAARPDPNEAGGADADVDDGGSSDAADEGVLPSFCSTSSATFCSSFEGQQPYGWPGTTKVDFAFGPGASPPNALELSAKSTSAAQYLSWTFSDEKVTSVEVKFGLNVLLTGTMTNGASDVVLVRLTCAGTSEHVDLKLKPGRKLQLQTKEDEGVTPEALEASEWTAVTFGWEIATRVTTAIGTFGNAQALTEETTCPALTVVLGFPAIGSGFENTYRVRYDNVEISVNR